MPDFPRSLVEFQSSFPDEGACVAYLFAARWPHGFVCPACGSNKAWRLQNQSPDLGVRRPRQADFGDRRHGSAEMPLEWVAIR